MLYNMLQIYERSKNVQDFEVKTDLTDKIYHSKPNEGNNILIDVNFNSFTAM